MYSENAREHEKLLFNPCYTNILTLGLEGHPLKIFQDYKS